MKELSGRRFNVYILFRLDKPKGEYIYGEGENQVKFEYEPFYVGEGTKKRMRQHFTPSNKAMCHNLIKNNIIDKQVRLGYDTDEIGKYFRENLTKEESLALERDLVSSIGRRDLGTGPLCNLNGGGSGHYKMSKKYKEISKNNLKKIKIKTGIPLSEDHRKRISKARTGKCAGKDHPFYGTKMTPEQIQARLDGKNFKRYKIISPNGKIYEDVSHLPSFCSENNLPYHAFLGVSLGIRPHWKGWRVWVKGEEYLREHQDKKPINIKSTKEYIVTSPEGEVYDNIKSMRAFCKEHRLSREWLRWVAMGEKSHYRGWSAKFK